MSQHGRIQRARPDAPAAASPDGMPFPGRDATRAQKVAWAQQRRADGLLAREVAAEAGLSTNAVYNWLSDPDGSKQRAHNRRYGGTCMDCGALTTGSKQRARPQVRCGPCNQRFRYESARWTQEEIVDAIKAWAKEHDATPTAAQWSRVGSAWPSVGRVRTVFGTWSAAIAAAGFTPRRVGECSLRTIRCDGCGAEVTTKGPVTRWCANCVALAQRGYARAWYEAQRERVLAQRHVFVALDPSQLLDTLTRGEAE